MKISELIAQLNTYLRLDGDQEVEFRVSVHSLLCVPCRVVGYSENQDKLYIYLDLEEERQNAR